MLNRKGVELMTRTYGVEIECTGATRDAIHAALVAAGIPCKIAGYGVCDRYAWVAGTDSSIHVGPGQFGTCELVSPILTGDEGLEQIRKVCAVLAQLGCTVNKSCGLHVHIGATDLTHSQMKNLAKRWVRDEQFIDLVMPTSRRANNSKYCQSNSRKFSTIDEAFKKIDKCSNFQGIRELMNFSSLYSHQRYHKMNFCSFAEHGTVEFRQHSGTVDADKIINWVIFLQCLINSVCENSFVRKWNEANFTFDVKKKVHYLCLVAGCPNSTRNFFMKRAAFFAGQ